MVEGRFPYSEKDDIDVLLDQMLNTDYYFTQDTYLSNELKDLMQHMLQIDVKKRYDIDQVLEHPWCQRELEKGEGSKAFELTKTEMINQ